MSDFKANMVVQVPFRQLLIYSTLLMLALDDLLKMRLTEGIRFSGDLFYFAACDTRLARPCGKNHRKTCEREPLCSQIQAGKGHVSGSIWKGGSPITSAASFASSIASKFGSCGLICASTPKRSRKMIRAS